MIANTCQRVGANVMRASGEQPSALTAARSAPAKASQSIMPPAVPRWASAAPVRSARSIARWRGVSAELASGVFGSTLSILKRLLVVCTSPFAMAECSLCTYFWSVLLAFPGFGHELTIVANSGLSNRRFMCIRILGRGETDDVPSESRSRPPRSSWAGLVTEDGFWAGLSLGDTPPSCTWISSSVSLDGGTRRQHDFRTYAVATKC